MNMIKKQYLIEQFNKKKLFKKGNFVLKSGAVSDTYFDLRTIISFPNLLKYISYEIDNLIFTKENIKVDVICGVPYGAISLATQISMINNIPLILKRKERKKHGTGKMVEGVFKKGDKCLLVEDVITSGKSIEETIEEIEKEGVVVEKIVCILDRQEGGVEKLKKKGYNVSAILTKNDFKTKNTNIKFPAKYVNKTTIKLDKIIKQKKSNICVAADLNDTEKIINLVDKIGEKICILKLHADIINNFNLSFIDKIKKISTEKNFLLWEDRKYTDIGNIVKNQFENKIHNVSQWADMVTLNLLSGDDIINSFPKDFSGIIVVNKMSSRNNLMDLNFQYKGNKIINKNLKKICGVVTQNEIFDYSNTFVFSPGVKIISGKDNLGQQYNTPEKLKKHLKPNVFVVGRGIYESKSPEIEIDRFINSCGY